MNYRIVLSSLVLGVFGIIIIVGTVYNAATNGFTGPATFYTSSTSIDTIGFQQGLVAIAVSGGYSSTITSQTEPGVTLFMTQVSVGFIPFQSQQSYIFYVLGAALVAIALAIPLHRISTREVTSIKKKTRPIDPNIKFCIECGAKLPSDARFCNKCGSAN
jgi:ribosomal protein L40E